MAVAIARIIAHAFAREEISALPRKIAVQICDPYGESMTFGKTRPKLAMSFTTRRIRLGVAHHGAPSTYTAPSKDKGTAPPAHKKQKRR